MYVRTYVCMYVVVCVWQSCVWKMLRVKDDVCARHCRPVFSPALQYQLLCMRQHCALGDIHLRFTWQAWHNLTSTVVLRGRRGTHGIGWRPWARFSRAWRRGTLRGRRGTWWHPPSFHVAGVAQSHIHLRFTCRTGATWNEGGCKVVSRLPRKMPRRVCVSVCVCDKVVCAECVWSYGMLSLCVCEVMVCERWYVTKLCVCVKLLYVKCVYVKLWYVTKWCVCVSVCEVMVCECEVSVC